MIAGRTCVNCESKSTYINTEISKTGKKWCWGSWHRYKDGFICRKCWKRLIGDKRKMLFKPLGKSIYLKENPRKGKCKLCEKGVGDKFIDCKGRKKTIKYINMHHKKYYKNDPLKDTEILCPSCHSKITMRKRLLKKQKLKFKNRE